MTTTQEHLNTLESLLVQEFRAVQMLFRLSQDERCALAASDVARLRKLANQKERVLDDLGALEQARQTTLYDLATDLGIDRLSVDDLLPSLEQSHNFRVTRLREGTLALMAQVRELTLGNNHLAASALEQTSGKQAQLINRLHAPLEKTTRSTPQAPGQAQASPAAVNSTAQSLLPAVFAAVLAAREALKANDQTAIASALDDLQDILGELSSYASQGTSPGGHTQALAQEAGAAPQDAPPKDANNLVERIASLYAQESAYQAVLKASHRMLASI